MKTLIKGLVIPFLLLALTLTQGCGHTKVDEKGEWKGIWNTVGMGLIIAAAFIAADLTS